MSCLIGVCTADLHFGAFDPREQYKILKEQFVDVIAEYPRLDYILICGDIYDRKFMGNSDALLYAANIIEDIVNVARMKNSTVILIHGTFSHDADQLKNFYHYMNDTTVDVRVITSIQYINVKGARMLCIPELYNVPEEIYHNILHYNGYYDFCFLHGTFEGSVYGDKPIGNGRLFRMEDFDMCRGFMVGGHVHTPGCHKGYFYYTGCPYRWRFGEEEEKGFITTVYDTDTHGHYIHFNPITSFKYITMEYKDIVTDPKAVIEYINNIQRTQNIDFLKIKFTVPVDGADKVSIQNYYKNQSRTTIAFMDVMEEKKAEDMKNGVVNSNYDFILDPHLSDMEKFVQFVNMKEGSTFITIDKLREILDEKI